MKKFLILSLLFILSANLYSQTVAPPVITFLSKSYITGTTAADTDIRIDTNADGKPEYDFPSDNKGYFKFIFPESLNVGSGIQVWSYDDNKAESAKVPGTILSDAAIQTALDQEVNRIESQKKQHSDMLVEIENQKKEMERLKKIQEDEVTKAEIKKLEAKGYSIEKETDLTFGDGLNEIERLNAEKRSLANTVLTYKATITHTNFNIPLVRFNTVKNDDTKYGDVLLFNSIGAGFGVSAGRVEITRDNEGEIVNEEFYNTIGVQVGALFSAGSGEDAKNVIAPTVNISYLDFQAGIGYELGTIASANQNRTFFTLSYGIPLYKLYKKSVRYALVSPIPIESKRRNNRE